MSIRECSWRGWRVDRVLVCTVCMYYIYPRAKEDSDEEDGKNIARKRNEDL